MAIYATSGVIDQHAAPKAGRSRRGNHPFRLTAWDAAHSLGMNHSPAAPLVPGHFIEERVMSKKAISLTISTLILIGSGVAMAQQPPARLVAVCAPPGGLWGSGNGYRGKIEKYADNTMISMGQNFHTDNPNRWGRSPPMPWTGGHYVSPIGVTIDVTPEGDGYRVAAPRYFAHFSCAPAAAAK
jgi:hypothetical protein